MLQIHGWGMWRLSGIRSSMLQADKLYRPTGLGDGPGHPNQYDVDGRFASGSGLPARRA